MTPAPISVERLSPAISDYPGNHFEDAEPIMVATLDGEYVRHSDYAALLHQLAEREAEVYLLRSWLCDCFVNAGADTDGSTDVRALSERAVQAVIDLRRDYDENEDWKGRACAAERAREEATGLLRKIDGLIPSEILGTQLCEELDALLATSGGA